MGSTLLIKGTRMPMHTPKMIADVSSWYDETNSVELKIIMATMEFNKYEDNNPKPSPGTNINIV